MPGIFEDVKLPWRGGEVVIPAERVMKAIAIVEDHFTIREVGDWAAVGSAPIGKLSMGYAAVLRYAGERVTDEEAYAELFRPGQMSQQVSGALTALLFMMIPPDAMKGAPPGKVAAAPGSPSRSSPRHTKRR